MTNDYETHVIFDHGSSKYPNNRPRMLALHLAHENLGASDPVIVPYKEVNRRVTGPLSAYCFASEL